MELGDVLYDSKAKPCAADLPAAGFIHAVEAFEYTRLML